MEAKYHIRFLFATRSKASRPSSPPLPRRVAWALLGWKDAVHLFEKDATNDGVVTTCPDDVDFDVARDIPHQVDAITEAG
jgi:hypothetical protein